MSQQDSGPHSIAHARLRWWQRGVTYQIYPRSFQDTTGDGIGDLAGVIERLDYLRGQPDSLGVDAIWLSPFYPSPMADFGYDVSDYCDVHPMFGGLETFDRLVKEAHDRGIKVIIDYVPNHTSNEHPWFLESRSSRDNPKRDWYIWRDPGPDGAPPNNWGSMFGGPAWEWDERTGQYYFHHFLKEQPDLNWRNREVEEAMLDVLRFWLRRGVDGFRMDVVGMILKDAEFRDNPPHPEIPESLHEHDLFHRQLNVYNQDLDEVHDVIREFRRVIEEFDDRCCIGEVWNDLPRWVRYYGVQGDGLNLPFNFRLIKADWNAVDVRRSVDELEEALPGFAWPNYVLGNHDVPRLASRVGTQQSRVAAMLLLTLRGAPTLYYGDELGLENAHIEEDQIQDPQGLRLGLSRTRDVARSPMAWHGRPGGGFTEVKPWLPFSPHFRERNVEKEQADPKSLLNLYKRLIALRAEEHALHGGSYAPVTTEVDHSCFCYRREDENRRFLVVLNFAAVEETVHVPIQGQARVALSTLLDREGEINLKNFNIREDEGLIIELL